MMKIRFLVGIVAVFFLNFTVRGQISGRVIGENNYVIEFAQVVAMNADSVIVGNTQTNEAGLFSLSVNGATILNVSALGYEPLSLSVSSGVDLGDIQMKISAIELKDVEITASRPVTKLEGTSLVTTVAGTYLSRLGTANDVLSWIPMVLGHDGDFTVFGKGRPLIYINGRKVMNNTDLVQLSSDNIRDVKVITNPGAKYSASVKSVIIIRTKKPLGEGFGINTWARGVFSNYFSPSGQVEMSYRTGGLDIGIGGYASRTGIKNESNLGQETFGSKYVNQSLVQNAKNIQTEYIGKFTLNYQINKNHYVGGYYRLGRNKETIDLSNHSEMYVDEILYDNISTMGISEKDFYSNHNANIYYNGTIQALEVDFNMDYYSSNPELKSGQKEISEKFGERMVTSKSATSARLWAQKLVVAYNFGASRIELGEEYTNSGLKMSYHNQENLLPNSNNDVEEQNISVFAQYTQMIGKKFQLEMGLRYENVSYDYYSNGTLMSDKRKTYNNLFPSIGASAQFDNVSLALSYSNKTQRPSYSQLDGNIYYNNRFQYQSGNPELQPVKKEAIEFTAQYQPMFLQASLQRQRRPILFYSELFEGNNDVNMITYINGPEIKELNVMIGTSLEEKKWNSQISCGIAKQWFKTEYRGELLSLGNPVGLISWETYIKLPYGLRLMWDYTYQTRGNMQNVFLHSHSILNVALYKNFCDGKLDVIVKGKDLFDGQSDNITMYSGNVLTKTVEKYNMRSCEITLRYRLNVPKSKYKGKGAGQTEKDRM